MPEDHSSARGFDLEPLDLAYSAQLGPNIVELDAHGTNGMEDWNDVEDYGMQESGIWDNHLGDNSIQENNMKDNDIRCNDVENNGTDDTP